MSALKDCFAQLGYEQIVTYTTSGNVIFATGKTNTRRLETTIEAHLRKTLKLPVTVVVRSLADMDELVADFPLSWHNPEGQKCNVIFLCHTIDNLGILKGLTAKVGIEELYYRPGALFWSANANELGKSNMAKLKQQDIYEHMTVRRLDTVRKVYDLMQRAAATV